MRRHGKVVQRDRDRGNAVLAAHRKGTLHVKHIQRIVEIQIPFQGIRSGYAQHAHGVAEHMQETRQLGDDRGVLPCRAATDREHRQHGGGIARHTRREQSQLLRCGIGIEHRQVGFRQQVFSGGGGNQCRVGASGSGSVQLVGIDVVAEDHQRPRGHRFHIVCQRGDGDAGCEGGHKIPTVMLH